MRIIYVIGAHCTGKTTLVEAVGAWLQHNMPQISFTNIREIARSTLRSHHFNREDVRAGGERCLRLQKLILQSQSEAEGKCKDVDLVVSDRSGIDPPVCARLYCGPEAVEEMMRNEAWTELRSSMRGGTVVVCEPVEDWLVDDGTRLMPTDKEEWAMTHRLFCETLRQDQIPYVILAAAVTGLDQRVNFVISAAGVISDGRSDISNVSVKGFTTQPVSESMIPKIAQWVYLEFAFNTSPQAGEESPSKLCVGRQKARGCALASLVPQSWRPASE